MVSLLWSKKCSVAACVGLWAAAAQVGFSQSAATQTVLDATPWTSTRANGMGGALSTIADDLDALYYNPAMIGGLGFSGQAGKKSTWSGLYFPYAGVSINENGSKTRNEFNAQGAQNDAAAGAAILDAHAGQRQYARATFIPIGLLLGRAAVVPMIDHQIAAVPSSETPGQVLMRYRTVTGAVLGASIADQQNRFALGLSQTMGTIEETYGSFQYLDIADANDRKNVMSKNRKTYAAKTMSAGLTMRIPKAMVPTLSIVARDIGNTKNSASDATQEPLVYDEDLTTGVSISPLLGRHARLNLILETGYLTQKHLAAKKKGRAGAEILLFGTDADAILGLRFGANEAGASYGAHLNLGLIGASFESHAVDIGANNERVIERRQSYSAYINVASF
jgi:hypothetical protein